MPKVNDYKQMTVYAEKQDGSRVDYKDICVGAEQFSGLPEDGSSLVVEFELKRRQSVSTWKSQITKAITSRLNSINNTRRNKLKKDGFTYDELLERLVCEANPIDDNNIKMIVWRN